MKRRTSRFLLLLTAFFLLVVPFVLSVSVSTATTDQRPFWTEKSAFVEGDDLYVVGIASRAKSAEAGRQQAFEHGKHELMNYAQVTNLEAQGLVVETQMTYEEPNPDGTVTVYRLLRVPASKLAAIQRRLQAQTRAQEEALEQAQRELAVLQQSLSNKQQELETRSREVQNTLAAVSQLQTALGAKAQKIDQQQRQVEQLLQQLAAELHTQATMPKGSAQRHGSTMDRLKEAEAQLDRQERGLDQMFSRIQARIQEASQKACGYVTAGMKPSEVKSLLGEPDGRNFSFDSAHNVWSYGHAQVFFGPTTPVVSHVAGCRDR